jgi:hypothetical protein
MCGPCDEIINGCANSELLCVHRQLFLRVVYNENKSQGSIRGKFADGGASFLLVLLPGGPSCASRIIRNFKKLS